MRRTLRLLTLASFLFSPVLLAENSEVRYPFVAGQFYPADKAELNKILDGFFEKAVLRKNGGGRLLALIVPHAGYFFSGQTAAYAYQVLKQHPVDTVVLLGPYHKAMFHGASVWTSGSWRTPMGDVPVDTELAQKIAAEDSSFQFTQSAHSAEHSLETQLPFLQKTLKNFKIVPILVSDASSDNVPRLAAALHKHLQGKNALVIASSDMSHYYPDETARTMDARMLELLKKQDPAKIFEANRNGEGELCGEAAVMTALQYAQLHGKTTLEVLHYATSADATHDKGRVVGYGASAIWLGESIAPSESILQGGLGIEQKKKLLQSARQSVEALVNGTALPPPATDEAVFKKNSAVFVTLKKSDQLRGCIGRILAEEPLGPAVQHMAVESATRDPRFAPVTPGELSGLHYEISVLSEPLRVENADTIVMGKHGVILSQRGHSGVFLPKVAEMFDWDKEMFLNELCTQKAQLPRDCWKDPATEIQVFTADEFSE